MLGWVKTETVGGESTGGEQGGVRFLVPGRGGGSLCR